MQCLLSLSRPYQFMSHKAVIRATPEIRAIPATTIQVLLMVSTQILLTNIILVRLRLMDLVLRVTCMTETNR
jgi:hypothetical protein